jgi:hypothetical protein
MTGRENNRPNGLIEHAPVTLRRFRAEDVDALFGAVTESLEHLRPAGTGTGVVWRLKKASTDQVT